MSGEQVRHYSRYAVNGLALSLAVMALPEFTSLVPSGWLPMIASGAAVLNTLLSVMRRVE